jgi:cytochrome o ubiquinol oxidase subunit 1
MFGKLTLDSIPYHEPIIMMAAAMMGIAAVAVLGTVTYLGKWRYLWSEWLTSVDHKRLGVMYIVVAMIMLLRGFADAIMMRTQLAIAYHNPGYLPPHHYDQIFSAHGVIMIFFMAMVFMVGLMNLIVPLQIGARDVAYPFLNSLSFWMTAVSVILINVSLVIGEFAQTGWLAYPPLSELKFSPGVGVDYYIWSLQLSGIGTLLTGINFFVTIVKMRAPGMTFMKMPVFTWTALCTNVLIMAAFPILTVTLALLGLDRYLGMHFFTNEGGGNAMLYLNLIWAWGHPEVYILILPAFGIFSEVIATYAKKPLFGYKTMVYATCAIMVLSFLVWLHHFFTMGSGADDHCDSDRREGLQLAVHDLQGPPRVLDAGAVDARLHGHLHDRRHDRRDDGDSGRGLRAAQQPVPDCSLPQRDHRRGAVRLSGWFQLLVPEGVRFQAERKARQGRILVLAGWLLGRVHTALRARFHGHDAPSESLRQPAMASVAAAG